MTERKVLGRGLSSLIRTTPPTGTENVTRPVPPTAQAGAVVSGNAATGVLEISVRSISVNPHQPRRRFSETALEELGRSLKRSGVLQPLLVRPTDRGYELIAGERRLRAARKIGLEKVPVVVRRTTDQDQLELALIENLQREDLNPIEEAQGYERLSREFKITQEEIASRVGKERSTVTNLLRLLRLTPAVQQLVASGAISMGHARAMLSLEDPRRQESLAHKIEKEGLSVRQVEGLIRSMLQRPSPKGRRATDRKKGDPNLLHLAEEMQRSLGTRVDILSRRKGGEIRIQYYSPEDLRRVMDQVVRPR